MPMTGEWEGGLLSCFEDMDTCIKGFCFTPIFMSVEKSTWDGTNCLLNFCTYHMYAPILRHQVRSLHGIPGNCCVDLLLTCLCHPCSNAQIMRTMKSQGPICKPMH